MMPPMTKRRPLLRPLRILSDDQLRAVTGAGSTSGRQTGASSTWASDTGRSSTAPTSSLVSNPPTSSK
jgi:hypothetical protein